MSHISNQVAAELLPTGLFGILIRTSSKRQVTASACRFLELPATTTFEDLLGTKAAAKSALKTTAGSTGAYGVPHVHGSVSMGQARKFVVHHFCDSQPLCFELQVHYRATAGLATLTCIVPLLLTMSSLCLWLG